MSLPRTYARVRAFDLACPSCGTVSALSSSITGTPRNTAKLQRRDGRSRVNPQREWNVTTGVFICRGCQRRYSIGLAIWRHPPQGTQPPGDRVPTPAEALALRGLVIDAKVGTGGRARGNLLAELPIETDPEIPPRRTVEGDAFAGMYDDPDGLKSSK